MIFKFDTFNIIKSTPDLTIRYSIAPNKVKMDTIKIGRTPPKVYIMPTTNPRKHSAR